MQLRRYLGRIRRNALRKSGARWGQDFAQEIIKRSRMKITSIFDIGGHIGQTALEFSDTFPDASIYTFEPSIENFGKMETVLAGKPKVKRLNIALGEKVGFQKFYHDVEHTSMSRIEHSESKGSYSVKVLTIDTFLKESNIDRIDIMKIDTEGYEIRVLRGAQNAIESGKIGFIKVECGTNPCDDIHINFREILDFLEPSGFRIFGVYDQWEDVFDPKPILRRADFVFAAQHVWSAPSL